MVLPVILCPLSVAQSGTKTIIGLMEGFSKECGIQEKCPD